MSIKEEKWVASGEWLFCGEPDGHNCIAKFDGNCELEVDLARAEECARRWNLHEKLVACWWLEM